MAFIKMAALHTTTQTIGVNPFVKGDERCNLFSEKIQQTQCLQQLLLFKVITSGPLIPLKIKPLLGHHGSKAHWPHDARCERSMTIDYIHKDKAWFCNNNI